MADTGDRKVVPAWQPPGKEQSASTSTSSGDAPPSSSTTTASTSTTDQTDAHAVALTASESPSATSEGSSEQSQRDMIKAFLQEPTVKDQTVDKKRAFLQGKGMPDHLIDEELASAQSTALATSDFESFQQESAPKVQPTVKTPAAAPPIITYPEFLANAHRPEPIITPGRILTTTYIAGAAAALLYGASTLLVKPMTAVLTDARHEFSQHSQSKVDELNARLEKLVSQIPGAKSTVDSDSDADSLASDPTDLFHRDMGTQTDAGIQTAKTAQVSFVNNDSAVAHAEKLKSLEKELESLLAGTNKQGEAVREREESVSKLRHYLDILAHNSNGIWSNHGATYGWENTTATNKPEKKFDSIEELKREIRGVKGVLLSAKRFPAAGQHASTARYRTPAQTAP